MNLQKTVETVQAERSSWRDTVQDMWKERKQNTFVLLSDLLHALVAFLFAGCHVLFGAYPLGIAWLASLSCRLWITLPAAVLGALAMGQGGVVYALTAVITVLLRMAVSGTGRADKTDAVGTLFFHEGRLLRACAAVIGGFICGVYEVLLSGVTLASVLYGATMALLSGVLAFIFVGVQALPCSLQDVLVGQAPILGGRRREELRRARMDYQLALSVLLFFCAYSLRSLVLFGVSAAYVFSALTTLFVAKRFGVLRGMGIGFISMLGLSTTHAVSYALGGLCAGLLYPLGIGYALAASVGAVGAWSALVGGLGGFVSAVPEFAIAAVLFSPLARRCKAEVSAERTEAGEQRATDMVGTMAMSYRAQAGKSGVHLEQAIGAVAPILHKLCATERRPDVDTYRHLLSQTVSDVCGACHVSAFCESTNGAALDLLAQRLAQGGELTENDLSGFSEDRAELDAFLSTWHKHLGAWEAEAFRRGRSDEAAELCEVFAKMLNEGRQNDERELLLDAERSRRLTEVFERHGFADGVVRLYGQRRPYLLAAAEDPEGDRITDERLFEDLQAVCGVTLGQPAFFRKGSMVLMECRAAIRYRIETAGAASARSAEEISGDSVACFEGADQTYYMALSDGMGSGEVAHRTSEFSTAYLSRVMGTGCGESTALFLLNRLIRGRGEECSATVDLFSFDLVLGEGQFYKSGAAPSYLKRGDALFRIRSQTVPMGLLRSLDAERIKVEVQPEDVVIMLSDGVSGAPEDDPWLIELLSRPIRGDLASFAEQILAASEKHGDQRDDRTVLVARICAA